MMMTVTVEAHFFKKMTTKDTVSNWRHSLGGVHDGTSNASMTMEMEMINQMEFQVTTNTTGTNRMPICNLFN
jgi:hypothetical protein